MGEDHPPAHPRGLRLRPLQLHPDHQAGDLPDPRQCLQAVGSLLPVQVHPEVRLPQDALRRPLQAAQRMLLPRPLDIPLLPFLFSQNPPKDPKDPTTNRDWREPWTTRSPSRATAPDYLFLFIFCGQAISSPGPQTELHNIWAGVWTALVPSQL